VKQENRWVKDRKGGVNDIKVGKGRIRINGTWRSWGEIEKEEEKEKDNEERRGRRENLENRYLRLLRDTEEERSARERR